MVSFDQNLFPNGASSRPCLRGNPWSARWTPRCRQWLGALVSDPVLIGFADLFAGEDLVRSPEALGECLVGDVDFVR